MSFESIRHAFSIAKAALANEKKRGPQASRGRDETEFMPAAIEVLETPASPTVRLTFWALSAFLVLGLVWSFIGELDVVAVAEGKTVPTGKIKIIQPLETGVVRAIHVQDGKRVKTGDVLIELDATSTDADVRRAAAELASAEIEAARLEAAIHPEDPLKYYKTPPGVPASLVVMNRTLLLSQVEEHLSRLAALEAEVGKTQAEGKAIEASIARAVQSMPLLKERVEARASLAEKGYGSRLTALELQQQLVELQQDLQGLHHRREQNQSTLVSLRKQRAQIGSEYAKQILGQHTDARRRIAVLEEELLKAAQRRDLQSLVAPIDGVVQQLAINTLGGVVTPAQGLMVIVPETATLEAEVMLLNRDIGFVVPSQEASIKLETFLFTKYGTLPGKVISVSRDAVQDEKRGLIYPARIELAKNTIDIEGRQIELGAGMALSAEIKTDRRRIIDYVLSPITRYRHETLRER